MKMRFDIIALLLPAIALLAAQCYFDPQGTSPRSARGAGRESDFSDERVLIVMNRESSFRAYSTAENCRLQRLY